MSELRKDPVTGRWVIISTERGKRPSDFGIIPKLTKFAGFEWGSGFFINPTPPEGAAKFLRELIL